MSLEILDYHKLIDPLCIPSIKALREDLEVDTLYCCQGSTEEERKKGSDHSIMGYIAVADTPRNEKIFIDLARSLNHKTGLSCIGYLELGFCGKIIFRLKKFTSRSPIKREKAWEIIEEILHEIAASNSYI